MPYSRAKLPRILKENIPNRTASGAIHPYLLRIKIGVRSEGMVGTRLEKENLLISYRLTRIIKNR